jgi:Holliday junction DNA helicase RuvA
VIGTLRGTVCEVLAGGRGPVELLIEVRGVGYRVQVNPSTAELLGGAPGEVLVWVHHHLREDTSVLFGFATRDERDVFETLLGAHGVGPSLALGILSALTLSELRSAIAAGDAAALCVVPGVGKKTAARLLVELASRLEVDLTDAPVSVGAAPPGSPRHDVREALVGLGYDSTEIAEVLRELPAHGDSAELLRVALRQLAGT